VAKSQSPKKNPKKEKKDVLDPMLFPGEIAADGIILYIIVIFLIENALPLFFFLLSFFAPCWSYALWCHHLLQTNQMIPSLTP
jgi:hypothetical protein